MGLGLVDLHSFLPGRLPRPRYNLWLAEHRAQLVDDGSFDLASGHSAHRARSGAMLQDSLADVVAVKSSALSGVGWRGGRSIRTVKQTPQQGGRVSAGPGCALSRAFREDAVHLVPSISIDDCLVLAGITGPLVDCLTDVDPVVQHPVDEFLIDAVATAGCDAPLGQFARCLLYTSRCV